MFPVVQTADTVSGTVTTNASTWAIGYPTNCAAGDLIIWLVAADGGVGAGSGWPTADSGSLQAYQNNGDGSVSLVLCKRVAAGGESGTFNVTWAASEQGSWRAFRITNWEGTRGTSWNNVAGGGAVPSVFYNFGSPSLNPTYQALGPVNWGTEDTLWIVVAAVDTSRTVASWPSFMTDLRTADVSGGSNGATLATAMLNMAGTPLSSGNWVMSASDDWVTATIAIRPAAGGGGSALTATPADTVALTDSISLAEADAVAVADTLALSDSVSPIKSGAPSILFRRDVIVHF